jgi:hypothetical protein
LANNAEKAAIGASILDRVAILDGTITVPGVTTDDLRYLGWGPVNANLQQVLSASGQYATINSSTGNLTATYLSNLSSVLDGSNSATACDDVEASLAQTWGLWVGALDPFAGLGTVTSFHYGNSHPSLESYFGTFGSPNNFFGIPGAGYAPPATPPTPSPTRRRKGPKLPKGQGPR